MADPRTDPAPVSREGEVDFLPHAGGPTFKTWFKTFGDIHSGRTPLVILHGGPGGCYEYLLPLADLWTSHGIPLVFYDQIGNGRSTHLPEKKGDEGFWTVQLFISELENLLEHLGLRERGFDLYGQSWGGMLGIDFAAIGPKGLQKLVLSNTLSSVETFLKGVNSLRAKLPQDVQEVLDRCEKNNDFESEEYEAAVTVFYRRHLCLKEPWPAPEVEKAFYWLKTDPTTYGTMFGPSELTCTGSLRSWTSIDRLPKITAPTLLIGGTEDEVRDVTARPIFNLIPKVKWIVLDNAAHFSHVDQRERYMGHLADFLVEERC